MPKLSGEHRGAPPGEDHKGCSVAEGGQGHGGGGLSAESHDASMAWRCNSSLPFEASPWRGEARKRGREEKRSIQASGGSSRLCFGA